MSILMKPEGDLSCYDKLLYGSDWSIVNVKSYISLVGLLVPRLDVGKQI